MKKTQTLPLVAALVAAFTSVSHGAVVYAETFGNTTGSTTNIASVGWFANTGATATAVAANNVTTVFLSGNDGSPEDLSNSGQTQTSTDASEEFGFAVIASAATPALVWTNEYTGSVALNRDTLDSVSFFQANNAEVSYRVALQIAGQWFASTSIGGATIGTTADFDSTAVQLELEDFTSTNWRQLTFNPGVTGFTLGATDVALAAGDVTAFGVYRVGGQVSRFDSYVISAIPEPSGAMLFGSAGFLVLLRRRR